jgi:threonine dehydrogenase-like Zn-dependent dehydrogenase
MKRVFVPEIGRVVVEDAAPPAPRHDEAVVTTLAVGICGSDTHAIAGHHPLLPPPYHPGHEAVGIIAAASADGTGPTAGTRVLLKPNVVCGVCANCRAGRSNVCERLAWVGCDPTGRYPGAMAEEFAAPARNLYPIDEAITPGQAALIECLATPVHATRIAGDLTGARVVVMGAGTIGALTIVAARAAGAATIVATDLDAGKLERAARIGADAAVDAGTEDVASRVIGALGGPADVVFDCVAIEASAAQWPNLLRKAGTACVVGVPPRDYVAPMSAIQDRELRVQGCASYTEVDIERSIAMAGTIPADEIITAVHRLDEAPAAFIEATRFSSGKVLVTPDGTLR